MSLSADPRDTAEDLNEGSGLGRKLAGYLAACLASALAIPIALLTHDMIVFGADAALSTTSLIDVLLIVIMCFVIAVIAAAPFATAFIVASAGGATLRSPTLFAIYGAITGLAIEIGGVILGLAKVAPDLSSLPVFGMIAAVGAVGGLVYWTIAVRDPLSTIARSASSDDAPAMPYREER